MLLVKGRPRLSALSERPSRKRMAGRVRGVVQYRLKGRLGASGSPATGGPAEERGLCAPAARGPPSAPGDPCDPPRAANTTTPLVVPSHRRANITDPFLHMVAR